MSYEILSVTFEVDSPFYEKGQFTVPIEVCSALDVRPGDDVSLTIETPKGKPIYSGVRTLEQKTKIRGADLSDCLKGGERIKVTISRLCSLGETIL